MINPGQQMAECGCVFAYPHELPYGLGCGECPLASPAENARATRARYESAARSLYKAAARERCPVRRARVFLFGGHCEECETFPFRGRRHDHHDGRGSIAYHRTGNFPDMELQYCHASNGWFARHPFVTASAVGWVVLFVFSILTH
jgi:hypothetical protein